MTPEKRAEKIWQIIGAHPERLFFTPSEKKASIAAQIREAQKEAGELGYANGWDAGCVEGQTKGFSRGRASMREEAAKVADKLANDLDELVKASGSPMTKYDRDRCRGIAERIRAIAVEGK